MNNKELARAFYKYAMGGKAEGDDPEEEKKPGDEGYVYDYSRMRYPIKLNPKGRIVYKEPEEDSPVPAELRHLRLDPRISDAAFDIAEEAGMKPWRVNKLIEKYLDKSSDVATYKMAKGIGFEPSKEDGILAPISYHKGKKYEESIAPIDRVLSKLSKLSDEDIESLEEEITKLIADYAPLKSSEYSKSERVKAAAGIAADQDWSGLKPIREKAGLSKDDIVKLIQAPEGAGFGEKMLYSIARQMASSKDFSEGGTIE